MAIGGSREISYLQSHGELFSTLKNLEIWLTYIRQSTRDLNLIFLSASP